MIPPGTTSEYPATLFTYMCHCAFKNEEYNNSFSSFLFNEMLHVNKWPGVLEFSDFKYS